MKAPITATEAFETANASVKKTFETADILISAGAQAKIISRFFEKFGADTPEDKEEDKELEMSAERTYHNAQKEYIKLFADDDDEEAKIDLQVEFYEQTEKAVECSYKICGIFRKHELPMYEKRLCDE